MPGKRGGGSRGGRLQRGAPPRSYTPALLAVVVAVTAAAIGWLLVNGLPPRSGAAAAFAELEREAREHPNSVQHALDCAETAVLLGRVAASSHWGLEALRRNLRHAHGKDRGAAIAGGVDRVGLLQLLSGLDDMAVSIVRYLRRAGTPEGIVQEIEASCGASAHTRELALSAGDLRRADVARVVAQCAVAQGAAADALSRGADLTSATHRGHTALHLLAHYGDAELLRDVAALFSVDEQRRQARSKDKLGHAPYAVALLRGNSAAAAFLAELAPEAAEAAPKALACVTGGAGCPVPERVQAPLPEPWGDGGWRGNGEGVTGPLREDWCRIVSATEPISKADFEQLALIPERPIIIRGGDPATATERLKRLRQMLLRKGLVQRLGEADGAAGPVPPEAGGSQHVMQKLHRFVSIATHSHHSISVPQPYWVQHGGQLGIKHTDAMPEWLLDAVRPDWRRSPADETITVFIGPPASGSPPHFHAASLSTLVFGLKRWWFIPPAAAFYGEGSAAEWATAGAERANIQGMLQCVQRPGDAVFVPDYWGHAALNLEHSVSVSATLDAWRQKFETRAD